MNDTAEAERSLPLAPHRPVPVSQCYLAYAAALLVGITAWWALQRLS